MNKNEIVVNGDVYVKKDSSSEGLKYVIVRTYSAGCFSAYLESYGEDNTEVNLVKARRLWYWDGASSLSQLAMEGVKRPENCKFPCEVDRIKLLGVIEVIEATEDARLNIAAVPVWQQ
jgi:hypothetical protein